MKKDDKKAPITFRMAGWYGMAFSICFLIYGGGKIILNVLDKNYTDFINPIVFTIVGLILISLAIAYRELKKWGWYGLLAMNGLVVTIALVSYTHALDMVLLLLSAAALVLLLWPTTRAYLPNK